LVFAATFIAIGLMGFVTGGFAPIWQPVSPHAPARELLIYLCTFIALGGGVGLLLRAAAAIAARGLALFLLIWMLLFKVPFIIQAPLQEVSYQSTGESAVLVAAAWVLAASLSPDADKQRLGAVLGDTGVRFGRTLYGLALIAFGFSHFVYLNLTAPIIPDWLPWHVGLAHFTGGAYLAAGAAIIVGIVARLAAVLAALQIGLITVLVWGPHLATGFDASQWVETVVSIALTAGAWVLADSYRNAPWLAQSKTAMA
jgi:uncharacterized membrane protein